MKIYAITNQKGGVGKSTTAQCLAAGLAHRGKKVVLIDLDQQGNTTDTFALKATPTAYELLTNQVTLADAIQATNVPNLSIIAGGRSLVNIEKELNTLGDEYQLKDIIAAATGVDYIIIDTPPAKSVATSNALVAADAVIIPSQSTRYSFEAVKEMYRTIAGIQRRHNQNLTIAGILLTRHQGRVVIAKDIATALTELAANIKTTVFKAVVPESIAIQQCQHKKKDLFTFSPKNKATLAYNAFIDELIAAE